jgi:hypothetical protein
MLVRERRCWQSKMACRGLLFVAIAANYIVTIVLCYIHMTLLQELIQKRQGPVTHLRATASRSCLRALRHKGNKQVGGFAGWTSHGGTNWGDHWCRPYSWTSCDHNHQIRLHKCTGTTEGRDILVEHGVEQSTSPSARVGLEDGSKSTDAARLQAA